MLHLLYRVYTCVVSKVDQIDEENIAVIEFYAQPSAVVNLIK